MISALALSVSIAVNADATETLESVGYPDGRILTSAQLPVSNVADCWQVKDHLGNVRVLFCLNSEGYMPVLEVNDYLPFGSRIQNASQPAFSLNRYRYAGKEEHNGFAACDGLTTTSLPAIDFGARFFIPFTSCWTTPDPLALKYLSISPYTYCMGNPTNYVDPLGLTNYVADKHTYVINDGCNETINLSRRQFRKLFNQFYDFHGNYLSMRLSIMIRNGYTDAAGNQVLAASQITSGGNSSYSPLSISSSVLDLSGDAMSNSNYSYRLTNSKKEFDFVMYKSGWTGNQYVRTNKVSDLGESSRVMGKYFGIISLGVSSFQLFSADNPSAHLKSGLDVAFGIIGFIPEIGAPISLIWSLCGSSLFDAYTDMLMQQIDTTTGRIPMYYHMTDY